MVISDKQEYKVWMVLQKHQRFDFFKKKKKRKKFGMLYKNLYIHPPPSNFFQMPRK